MTMLREPELDLEREVDVRQYASTVAARWWLPLLGIVAGVVLGYLPIPALLALVAVPLARRVYGGLDRMYDSPYGLMSVMAVNIRLHLIVGAVLLLAYVAVIVVSAIAPGTPLFLRR